MTESLTTASDAVSQFARNGRLMPDIAAEIAINRKNFIEFPPRY